MASSLRFALMRRQDLRDNRSGMTGQGYAAQSQLQAKHARENLARLVVHQ